MDDFDNRPQVPYCTKDFCHSFWLVSRLLINNFQYLDGFDFCF